MSLEELSTREIETMISRAILTVGAHIAWIAAGWHYGHWWGVAATYGSSWIFGPRIERDKQPKSRAA